jgi:hypothetical protein
MGRRRQGQNSLEFIVLFGFLFIVFLGFSAAIQEKIREQNLLNQQAMYVQLADKVEREFLLASRVGAGYLRSFDLPLTLNGERYNVTLEDPETLVIRGTSSNNEYLRFLSVNVTLEKGTDYSDGLVPEGKQTVFVQKNDTGIYVRKDCVAAGLPVESCI